MNHWVYVTCAVLVTLVAVITHEAAHGIVLRRLGVPIEEVGLGLRARPRLVVRTRRLPFAVSLSPWLVSAYVLPDQRYERELDGLSYRDKCWYAGAGVLVNFVTGIELLALVLALEERWTHAVVFAVVGLLSALFHRWFTAYVLPVVSVGALAAVVLGFVNSYGGPVGPVAYATLPYIPLLEFAGLMSVSLAVLNAIPIYPLDGGRIVDAVLESWAGKKVATHFQVITGVIMLLLVVYVALSDVAWLVLH